MHDVDGLGHDHRAERVNAQAAAERFGEGLILSEQIVEQGAVDIKKWRGSSAPLVSLAAHAVVSDDLSLVKARARFAYESVA
jgi:hypothetical protein